MVSCRVKDRTCPGAVDNADDDIFRFSFVFFIVLFMSFPRIEFLVSVKQCKINDYFQFAQS
jgi:hypothetical protein